MPPFVPPELVDHILSHFEGEKDRETLCACACVCRTWLPIARCYLFRRVTIMSPRAYDSFVQQVLHSNTLQPYLPTVRRLCLYYYSRFPTFRLGDLSPEYPRMECTPAYRLFLLEFAGRLPHLEALTLIHVDWSAHVPLSSEPLLMSTFPMLTYLRLRTCALPSFPFLRRALTAMPSLENFSMFEVIWHANNMTDVVPSADTEEGICLLKFNFEYFYHKPCSDALLLWLLQTPSCSSIDTLRFKPCYYIHPDHGLEPHRLSVAQERFLTLVAPHIVYATLTPVAHRFSWGNVEKLVLDATPAGLKWAELYGLLRAVPRMEWLQIRIRSSPINTGLPPIEYFLGHVYIRDDEVKELDVILTQERQKPLRRAEFIVIRRRDEDDMFADLGRRLPRLHREKILVMNLEYG